MAGRVGAQLDQVARLVVLGQHLAHPASGVDLLLRRHRGHHPGNAALHVDGGKVAALGQLAREHDVAVQDAARGVRNRVLWVVAFTEHRIEGRDGPLAMQAVA